MMALKMQKVRLRVKLLIDIPEWLYQDIQEYLHPSPLDKVIQQGVPLDATEYKAVLDILDKLKVKED